MLKNGNYRIRKGKKAIRQAHVMAGLMLLKFFGYSSEICWSGLYKYTIHRKSR